MMLSGLWKYAAGVLAAVAGLLGAALLYTGRQKERAQEAAQVAKANAKGANAARDIEQRIDNARAQARDKAREVERDQIAQQQAGDRPDVFGDPRLRVRDNQDDDHQS